jgi:hypothetical protein
MEQGKSQRAEALPAFGEASTRPRCGVCKGVIVVDYHATDELWEAALHPSWRNGYVCIGCLASAADEKNLPWDKHIREVRLISLTHKTAPTSFFHGNWERVLREAREAIASLDENALGMVRMHPSADDENGYAYPIRDELLAKIDAAIASVPPVPIDDGWQPIETAPDCEDGILICDATKPNPAVGLCRLMDNGKWMGANLEWGFVSEAIWPTPTHWRPLPNPPSLHSNQPGDR